MQTSLRIVSTFCALGIAAAAWAGPAEEVAQIAAPRVEALQEGNLDGWSAAFADNAVLTPFSSPFRIEGKEAIRAYFANLFQQTAKRKLLGRGYLTRVYGDNLVIQNGHGDYYLTNQQGEVKYLAIRWSVIWSKVSGQWQIVEQHVSRLPTSE